MLALIPAARARPGPGGRPLSPRLRSP
jgi:hypothetical protein